MSDKLKTLQEQRMKLAGDMRSHRNELDNLPQDAEPAEWQQKWDELNAAYDGVMSELEAENKAVERQAAADERLASIESSLSGSNDPIRSRIGRDGGTIAAGPVNRDAFGGDGASTDCESFAMALQGWMLANSTSQRAQPTEQHREAAARMGVSLNKGEFSVHLPTNYGAIQQAFLNNPKNPVGFRNDLSAVSGSSGSYTIGSTFVERLERAMLAYGGMLRVSEVIRTSHGEPMRWPTADDTGNSGVQLEESTSIGSSVDPSFGSVTWNAYKFSSQPILVPYELIEDSAINLIEVLGSMMGERLGRIQNTKFTTGTAAGTAKGIVTAATAGVTTTSSTAIAWDELFDLEHSLDPSRRMMPDVGFMFHDNVLKALRKLKDGDGQYLWSNGTQSNQPDMINGYSYVINQDMASSIASGEVTVLFGQFSQYKIRQVNEVRFYRLQERYRDTDQDGFIAFVRSDGNLLDAGDGPVRKMTQV